jgi:hypothetical protein
VDDNIGFFLCVLVLSGVGLIAMAMRGRQKLRELAIRERIALIERGTLPPPEVDPERFDRNLLAGSGGRRPPNPKGTRYRTMGVMLMGLGGALFLLLTFAAGVADVAFGVAGGVFVLGLAAYFNGMLVSQDVPAVSATPFAPPGAPASAAAPRPPDNVAP